MQGGHETATANASRGQEGAHEAEAQRKEKKEEKVQREKKGEERREEEKNQMTNSSAWVQVGVPLCAQGERQGGQGCDFFVNWLVGQPATSEQTELCPLSELHTAVASNARIAGRVCLCYWGACGPGNARRSPMRRG